MTDEHPPSRRSARQAEGPKPRRAPREKTQKAPADAAPVVDENGNPIAPKGGILAAIRKHPTAWLFSALAVVFVLLGTGAVFAGIAYGSTPEAAPTPEASQLRPRPQPSARADRREAAHLLGERARRTTRGSWPSTARCSAPTPARSCSTATASTAAAHRQRAQGAHRVGRDRVLGADFQIPTRIFAGSTAGTIVLVGHGDATLSAMPPGTESVYAGARSSASSPRRPSHLRATQPRRADHTVVLDASYWNPSDKWDASWKRSEQTIGYHSEVTALQVDGDRADPTKQTSPRSTDPITRAGKLFVNALKAADTGGIVADDVTITTGIAGGRHAARPRSSRSRCACSSSRCCSTATTPSPRCWRASSRRSPASAAARPRCSRRSRARSCPTTRRPPRASSSGTARD